MSDREGNSLANHGRGHYAWLQNSDEKVMVSRIASMGWLAAMPAAFREEVLTRAESRRVVAGEPLYFQGEGVSGLYGLTDGTVEVSIVASGGGPALIYLAQRGWWFGALEIFTRQPRRFHIQARTDCELVFLPGSQVREICSVKPTYWEGFARLMCANYESMADAVAMMRDPSPDRRVAQALLILYSRQAERERVVRATQADIASIANVSARTAATALARLEGEGLAIRGYGTVTIPDPERLSKGAGSDLR